MKQEQDWKSKYKTIVNELEGKEVEWQEVDSLLRKTISRLSIAGRGFDNRLDDQLKNIQNLSRAKKDKELADALEKLSRVVASLDDNPVAPSTQDTPTAAIDSSALLLALLKELQLKDDQRTEVKAISVDLLQLLGSGKSHAAVKPQIQKLSSLINANFDANKDSVTNDASDHSDREAKDAINSVLTTLLEKLAEVQGAGESARLLQTEALDHIDDRGWPTVLDQIIKSIAESLNKLNREKLELEDFIVRVTQQLGTISEVIAADQKDHRTSHKERHSLQELMHSSIKTIEADFDNASEIGQLKNIVAKNLNQIQSGIEDYVTRANERQEAIDERNSHLVAQIADMDRKTQTLKKRLDENREKLLFDTLTGAGSRLSYDEKLEREMDRWKRYGDSFCYVILDIDHFKKINDKYGHSAGDKALKIVSKMMLDKTRKSDSIYRIGGEEFVLLLPNTKIDNAEALVTKLRKTIEESAIHCNQERIVLTLSAGITIPDKDDSVDSLYQRADAALYQAKNSGRNCQVVA